MKKLGLVSLCLTLLLGCSSSSAAKPAETASTEDTAAIEGLQILAPTGAPGYALLPIALMESNEITLQDGADALQAAFVNPTPTYDVIIAPTNLGVKLAAAGKTTYQLAGIVTTGNLYIVSADENVLDNEEATIAVFGENAVPGLVFNSLYSDISCKVEWYDSVTSAQAALLSGNADAALLADPAATATIAKAKENGTALSKIADVQEAWGENGYPQAGLFVQKDTVSEKGAVYAAMLNTMQAYAEGEHAIADDLTTLESSGSILYTDSVAYAMVEKAYNGMGIHPSFIDETQLTNLKTFLDLFDITFTDDVIADLN